MSDGIVFLGLKSENNEEKGLIKKQFNYSTVLDYENFIWA